MSLKNVAHHLASKGRGPDRTLVHMSPREVGGLQALAKAHGGSLTINPETGLVEAGFLERLLPTLAGAGLMMIPGMQPLGAAALVGGTAAIASGGDLKAGLMAGLGAYGGAGLAEGAFAAGSAPGGDAVLAEGAGSTGAGALPTAPDVGVQAASSPATTSAVQQGSVQGTQLGSLNETGQFANGFQPTTPLQSTVPSAPSMTPPPMDVRSAYDPSFQTPTYNGPTQASLKPEATGFDRAGQNFMAKPSYGIAAIAPTIDTSPKPLVEEDPYNGPLSKYKFDPDKYRAREFSPPNPYYQPQMYRYGYAEGGPIERMSNQNEVGMNTGYPGADINQGAYATPYQTPISRNVVTGSADTGINPMNGEMRFANGGGISTLGGYSDGGRLLKGPGDGMSDNIPAQIGSKQPARLADGEFVVPADVVSHLGNGSTDAGARQLYSMMDRIRAQRTGKKKQAPKVNPSKAMPA